MLFYRWFGDGAVCGTNDEMSNDVRDYRYWALQNPGRITMHEYWSVFLFLIVGISISTVVAAMEIFWFKYKGRVSLTCFDAYTIEWPHTSIVVNAT